MKISTDIQNKVRTAKVENPNLSTRELGAMFGVHKSTVSNILLRPENGQVSTNVENYVSPERVDEIKGDAWNIQINKTNISNLDELIIACKIDLQVWEIERCQFKHWGMGFVREAVTTKGDEEDTTVRESGVQPLFSVTAICKRKKHMVDARAEIETLKSEAKAEMRYPTPVIYTTQDSDNALELLIPDVHLAKLAYNKETGFQNYDVEIAVNAYRRAIDNQIQQNAHFNIDKIVLGVGNDLLQADNIQGTTFGGTKVDVDSRYRKSYVTARKMLSEAIEKLRQIAPVEVKVVPGNHDTLSSFTLGDSLECKFENYSDVFVDNQPLSHKIFEWGDVLLALMHGDKGKRTKYGVWLATTYPQLFGRTRFREIHLGHKHKLDMDEEFGIVTRTFRAICPPDEWHSSNLFTGNLRSAEGLMWNKTRGLINQSYYTELD